MEVQLLPRGGEVVDVEGDRVALRLLVVRDLFVDPDDSHDLRNRRVEDRHLLVHDLRRLVRDPREDELDDLELLLRLGAVGLLREMRLEAAAALFQREVELCHDFVDGCDGLFRLGRVGYLRRAKVDEDDCRTEREALSSALLQAVPPPVDVCDGLGEGAAPRLVQERDPVREPEHFDRLVWRKISAIDDSDFNLKWISGIHCGIPRERRGIELRSKVPEDVLEAALDEPFPDRAEAVRRRGHQLRGLHGVVERFRLFEDEGLRLLVWVEARGIADFLRDAGRDPHELLLEERGQLVGFRLLHHGHERAELDAMRVRRNFLRLRREILRGPLEDDFFAFGRPIRNACMGIHDRRGLQVFGDRLLSRSIAALQRDFDPCAMGSLPDHEVFFDHVRPVLLRIQDEFDFVGDVLLCDLRSNLRWLAGRDLTVHDRTRNAKTLLSAPLSAAKKSRTVQQASEDVCHFFLDDARSIVFHDHDEFFFVDLLDLDEDVREDVRIGPRIEGIVHTLLDRSEEGFRRGIVAEDLLVPLEELGDADLPLFLREFLRDRDRRHTITGDGSTERWAFPSLGPAYLSLAI